MKIFLSVLIAIVLTARACNQASNQEAEVRQTVQSFFDAFNNHEFENVPNITTEDWYHINPLGGCTKGREAVLNELLAVHSSFLKGVSMTIEEMTIRFASPETAVATVTNKITTYTTPDGVKHENERQIKTFLLVKRNGKWLIMQDQNTVVGNK